MCRAPNVRLDDWDPNQNIIFKRRMPGLSLSGWLSTATHCETVFFGGGCFWMMGKFMPGQAFEVCGFTGSWELSLRSASLCALDVPT